MLYRHQQHKKTLREQEIGKLGKQDITKPTKNDNERIHHRMTLTI